MQKAVVQLDPYKTVPLSKFYPELQFEFVDLPTELFSFYILRTARDMAERAQLIKRTLTIAIQPCVTRYYIDVPDGLALKSLMSLRHVPTGNMENGSREIPRFTGPPDNLSWASRASWLVPDEKVLVIVMPQAGGTVRAVVSAMPTTDACELPSEYYDDYYAALIMGTRASIMMVTNRPWTNLRVGGELYNQYTKLVENLGVIKQRNKQAGVIRMRHGRAM